MRDEHKATFVPHDRNPVLFAAHTFYTASSGSG